MTEYERDAKIVHEALNDLLILLVDENRTSDEHEAEIRGDYAPAFAALARLAEYERCFALAGWPK